MHKKLHMKTLIASLLIVVFILTASSELIAQEKKLKDSNGFNIVVENTKNGIKMHSTKGSAWIDLSFNLVENQAQMVDEYGMTSLEESSSEKNSKLADFLFTIAKTENTIIIKGIKGTVWKNLSFSLAENRKQAIDQFGMTKLN